MILRQVPAVCASTARMTREVFNQGPKEYRWLGPVIGVGLVLVATQLAWGRDTDFTLQGRVLIRSDGSLYVYKDGWKYPIEPADVSDDVIDAIPVADVSVAQLDELFAPALRAEPTLAPPLPVYGPPAPVSLPPYVAVNNPSPGDVLSVGGLSIKGKAFDPAASIDQASGIDRVQVFLEDRDRGGQYLGDARLGGINPAAEPGSQFALAGWDIVVTLPSGSHILFIYARSSVTGKESTVTIPVRVGRAS